MIWKFIAVFSIILCKKCPKQFIFSIPHTWRGGATSPLRSSSGWIVGTLPLAASCRHSHLHLLLLLLDILYMRTRDNDILTASPKSTTTHRQARKKAKHSLFPYFSTLFIFFCYDISRDLIRMKIIYSYKSFQTYCALFWDLLRFFLKLSYKRI